MNTEAEAVYFRFASYIGKNAYVRKVIHTKDGGGWTTSWEVGTFQEVGQYSVLADQPHPELALAEALHASGAIIPR